MMNSAFAPLWGLQRQCFRLGQGKPRIPSDHYGVNASLFDHHLLPTAKVAQTGRRRIGNFE